MPGGIGTEMSVRIKEEPGSPPPSSRSGDGEAFQARSGVSDVDREPTFEDLQRQLFPKGGDGDLEDGDESDATEGSVAPSKPIPSKALLAKEARLRVKRERKAQALAAALAAQPIPATAQITPDRVVADQVREMVEALEEKPDVPKDLALSELEVLKDQDPVLKEFYIRTPPNGPHGPPVAFPCWEMCTTPAVAGFVIAMMLHESGHQMDFPDGKSPELVMYSLERVIETGKRLYLLLTQILSASTDRSYSGIIQQILPQVPSTPSTAKPITSARPVVFETPRGHRYDPDEDAIMASAYKETPARARSVPISSLTGAPLAPQAGCPTPKTAALPPLPPSPAQQQAPPSLNPQGRDPSAFQRPHVPQFIQAPAPPTQPIYVQPGLGEILGNLSIGERSSGITRIRTCATSGLKSFSGKEPDEERALAWISKVMSAFKLDRLEEAEKCELFPEVLSGPAKNWYRQLPNETKASFLALCHEFKLQYCADSESAVDRYYSMRRRPDEELLDYLFRFNIAASDARMPVRVGEATREQCRSHIQRFIRSLGDDPIASTLTMLNLQDEQDLKKVLMALRQLKTRSLQNSKLWKKKESRDRERPINMIKIESPLFNRDQPDLSSSDESNESDDDGCPQIMIAGQRNPAKDDKRGDELKCTHCGSKKHADLQCWKRLICQTCGKKGHPTDRCYQTCKGCGEVHAKGECKFEAIYNQLLQWYDPTQHAGLLPPQLEKLLN